MPPKNPAAVLASLSDPNSAESLALSADLEREPADSKPYLFRQRRTEMLAEMVGALPPFASGQGFILLHGDGGTAFRAVEAARFLFRRVAHGVNPETAIEELLKVAGLSEALGSYILTVWGVTVEKRVELSETIAIERWQDLPDSIQKQWISDSVSSDSRNPLAPSFFHWVPRAAIVLKQKVKPLLLPGNSQPPLPKRLLSDTADEVRIALTAIGPSAPVPAAAWFQFDDPMIQDAVSYDGLNPQFIEIVPTFPGREVAIPEADARSVVSDFTATTGTTRGRLRLALERLNNAQCRRYLGDTAIELGICLELLLVDGRGEHTFKVGLRAANLWKGSLAEKQRIRAILQGVYEVRSAMVHSAQSPAVVRLHGLRRMRTENLLQEALITVAALIRTILADGALPDWAVRDLVLP